VDSGHKSETKREKAEIAKKFNKKRIPLDVIADTTGLKPEEIEKI